MDAIDTFLEAMFAPYPATPRLSEAKRELHAMMEDAYADAVTSGKSHNEAVGQVITDFGNLEELAPVLGILPDIRDAGAAANAAPPIRPSQSRQARPSQPRPCPIRRRRSTPSSPCRRPRPWPRRAAPPVPYSALAWPCACWRRRRCFWPSACPSPTTDWDSSP
ncbi:permease prefix domain 1-containing protein [Actinomyces ruminis]|uniref:permease prefix domain 1-containing protein n=1 Tax=Actinomyces ruminis TaxID=1937003 RepID=UPI001C559131|nr:permease prefix domain 1-containing protein [Actinomyces ruminis]